MSLISSMDYLAEESIYKLLVLSEEVKFHKQTRLLVIIEQRSISLFSS